MYSIQLEKYLTVYTLFRGAPNNPGQLMNEQGMSPATKHTHTHYIDIYICLGQLYKSSKRV